MNKSVYKTQVRDAYGRFSDRDRLIKSLHRHSLEQDHGIAMLFRHIEMQDRLIENLNETNQELVQTFQVLAAEFGKLK